ncbi:MAG: hypothetical protein AB7N99_08680 [Simkaniaceae bacterium]
MYISEDPQAEQKAQAQYQDIMTNLSTMSAEAAFTYLSWVVPGYVEQFQGYETNEISRDQTQIATDQNLANEISSDYISYGNLQQQIDAINNGTQSGDVTQLEAQQDSLMIDAQQSAAQLDYDLHTAPVYTSQTGPNGNPFVDSCESSLTAILPDTSTWMYGSANPDIDDTGGGVGVSNSDTWSNDWTEAEVPTQYSGPSSTASTDSDPTGVQERESAMGSLTDNLTSVGQMVGEYLKNHIANMNETYSIEHNFDGGIVDQEKAMVQNLQQAGS